MTLETAMIQAIKKFKKAHKTAEIRTCSAWEMSGAGKTVDYALFYIEYVNEAGGDYQGEKIVITEPKTED